MIITFYALTNAFRSLISSAWLLRQLIRWTSHHQFLLSVGVCHIRLPRRWTQRCCCVGAIYWIVGFKIVLPASITTVRSSSLIIHLYVSLRNAKQKGTQFLGREMYHRHQHVLTTGLLHGDGCFFRCFNCISSLELSPSAFVVENASHCGSGSQKWRRMAKSCVFPLCYFDTNFKSNEKVNNYA